MRIPDLVKLYETKTDEELVQLAADSTHLIPEAHAVLAVELGKRRLSVTADSNPQGRIEPPTRLSFRPPQVGEFVAEVFRVYHGEFWLFVKLVAPAVVVGYIAILQGRQEAREAAHLAQGSSLSLALFAPFVGYFVSWTAFSVSFGAICSAVRQIGVGTLPSVRDSFAAVGKRRGPFFRLSLVLFFLCLLAFGAAMLLSMAVLWLSIRRHLHLNGLTLWILSFGFTGLTLLVLSRFALAVPAVVLDNSKVGQAMFRSDELTEGKWLILAVLLAKSLIGGYIAGMCPFWVASWIPRNVPLPSWFLWALTLTSISAVTVVEPTMFIGFGLLYEKASVTSSTAQEVLAVGVTPP
jgi:hypothetical protein